MTVSSLPNSCLCGADPTLRTELSGTHVTSANSQHRARRVHRVMQQRGRENAAAPTTKPREQHPCQSRSDHCADDRVPCRASWMDVPQPEEDRGERGRYGVEHDSKDQFLADDGADGDAKQHPLGEVVVGRSHSTSQRRNRRDDDRRHNGNGSGGKTPPESAAPSRETEVDTSDATQTQPERRIHHRPTTGREIERRHQNRAPRRGRRAQQDDSHFSGPSRPANLSMTERTFSVSASVHPSGAATATHPSRTRVP